MTAPRIEPVTLIDDDAARAKDAKATAEATKVAAIICKVASNDSLSPEFILHDTVEWLKIVWRDGYSHGATDAVLATLKAQREGGIR